MDDGDGAFVLELMSGKPNSVLPAIYHNKTHCPLCGADLVATTSAYTGGLCPECRTTQTVRRVH